MFHAVLQAAATLTCQSLGHAVVLSLHTLPLSIVLHSITSRDHVLSCLVALAAASLICQSPLHVGHATVL